MTTESTKLADKGSAEIERDVNRERERVSDTIDALQRKVSVGNIVDDMMTSVSQHGGDFGRNLARSVRDNPVPVILTGIGLAWMMAGSSDRGRGERAGDYYGGRGYWDQADSSGTARPLAEPGDWDEPGSSLGSQAREAGDEIGRRFSNATDAAAEKADELADKAKRGFEDAERTVRSTAADLRERAGEAGRSVREGAETARRHVASAGQTAKRSAVDFMEEQPLVMGAIALSVGAAIGGALPRTRTEDTYLGPYTDRAKASAKRVASEETEKAKSVANAVLDEAKQIGDEIADEAEETAPAGDTAAGHAKSQVEDAATRLKERAEREAESQNLGQIKKSGSSGDG